MATATSGDELREARLSPPSRLPRPDLVGLVREHELVYFLAWRDVKVLYKQTVMGVAWVVIQPLAMTAIATLVFHRVAHVSSGPIPYPVFALAGFLPWGFFAAGVTSATLALVKNRDLVTKIYFPRLALPVAGIVASLINLVVGIGVLLVVMGSYDIAPKIQFVLVPLAILLVAVTTFAVGLITSAVNVLYRDVAQAVPFLLQAGLFLTPIFYSLSSVGTKARLVYSLDPMTGCIEITRWILVGGPTPGSYVLISLAVTALTLVGGLLYFARVEQTFADLV